MGEHQSCLDSPCDGAEVMDVNAKGVAKREPAGLDVITSSTDTSQDAKVLDYY